MLKIFISCLVSFIIVLLFFGLPIYIGHKRYKKSKASTKSYSYSSGGISKFAAGQEATCMPSYNPVPEEDSDDDMFHTMHLQAVADHNSAMDEHMAFAQSSLEQAEETSGLFMEEVNQEHMDSLDNF